MMLRKFILTAFTAVLVLGGGIASISILQPSLATAQTSAKSIVDAAKKKGQVGETVAGYLALPTGSASSEITNAMNEINIGRKKVYTQLARQRGVSVDEVARITGENLVKTEEAGVKVLNAQGVWVTVR